MSKVQETPDHLLAEWIDKRSRQALETLQALLEVEVSLDRLSNSDRPVTPEQVDDAMRFVQELLKRDTQEPLVTYTAMGGVSELWWSNDEDEDEDEEVLAVILVPPRSLRMIYENESWPSLDWPKLVLGWGCHYE
jgi:hypothetical protein